MPSFPGITSDLDWAASFTGPVLVKGTSTAYSFTGTAATGISDPDYPAVTARGVVYLDGTFYVMEPDGTIWNSTPAGDDPTTWPTDGFVSAQFEPDTGVCIAKALNYVVALGQWTTELFWNVGGVTGSPIAPVNNGVILIGCVSAASVAQTESTLIWVAQRKAQSSSVHFGRFIAILIGTSYKEVSNPDISRLLEAVDISNVRSCILELSGHTWYVLTLTTLNITLVYDLKTELWYVWTRYATGSAKTISSLQAVNGLVTGTSTSHGFSDGDPVVVTGVTPAGFNGTFNVNVPSSGVFTYPLNTAGTVTGTGTSCQATPYTESPFNMVSALGYNGAQLAMDSAGNTWELTLGEALDNGSIPLNWRIRTINMDQGNNRRKFCFGLSIQGDVTTSSRTGLVRCTDDDYNTYGYFRRFDTSEAYQALNRWGNYRRRAWEWRYTDAERMRIKVFEPELEQGDT